MTAFGAKRSFGALVKSAVHHEQNHAPHKQRSLLGRIEGGRGPRTNFIEKASRLDPQVAPKRPLRGSVSDILQLREDGLVPLILPRAKTFARDWPAHPCR
jgi:hypothetical protein